jgi:hypothetical protein
MRMLMHLLLGMHVSMGMLKAKRRLRQFVF